MIRLFDSSEKKFSSQSMGLGIITDAITCEVVEERNGIFELEMEYHISGIMYNDIQSGRFIVTEPNPYDNPQPFRIYYISKPFNGLINVKAQHISYDMSGYPVSPIDVGYTFVDHVLKDVLPEHVLVESPFKFEAHIDKNSETNGGNHLNGQGVFRTNTPQSQRSILDAIINPTDGNGFDFSASISGPEYKFDVYNVSLYENRGQNRGVSIKYGKNLTDITQEEDIGEMYTAVYPFFYNDEWGFIDITTATSGIPYENRFVSVNSNARYSYEKIYVLDITNDWKNKHDLSDNHPSSEEIEELAKEYIKKNPNLGTPKISLTVSFEDLSKTTEYEKLNIKEEVQLCDLITVEFPKLNISTVVKCIKTTYDAISGKYSSIDLGDPKSDLSTSFNNASQSFNGSMSTGSSTSSTMPDNIDFATDEEANAMFDEIFGESA